MKIHILFFIVSFFFLSIGNGWRWAAFSQTGGNSVYNFLKISSNARSSALGGNVITVNDSDIALVSDNPSLLNSGMNNNFSLSYVNYLSDINAGNVSYARNFKTIGIVYAGLQYINYGKFTETDIYDQKLGEFSSGDYAFNLSFSKKLHEKISAGGTVKTIYSALEEYKSYGIAADLAGTYSSKNNSFVSAFILKNIGAQIKTYSPDIRESLPFEIQLGISKKIKYAPIRIYYTLKNLQKWNLADSATTASLVNKEKLYKVTYILGSNLFLHSTLGIEISPIKSFVLRIGYDALKRNQMRLASRGGITGFSFGAGIRILRMRLSYARNVFQFSGASNTITLTTNFSEFVSKKSSSILFEEIKSNQ